MQVEGQQEFAQEEAAQMSMPPAEEIAEAAVEEEEEVVAEPQEQEDEEQEEEADEQPAEEEPEAEQPAEDEQPQEQAAESEELDEHPDGAAKAEEEAKKRAEEEEALRRRDFSAVGEAIIELNGIPATARQMLEDGLPFALPSTSCADAFGAMQTAFTSLVAEAMNGELTRLAAATEESGSCQQEAEEGLLKYESEVISATEAATEAAADFDSKATASRQAGEAAEAAEVEHQKAQRANKDQIRAFADIREACSKATEVAEGALKALMEGSLEDEEAKENAAASVLEYVNDKVLAVAAPPALTTSPDERRPFDIVTVDAVAGVMATSVQKAELSVAEIAPEERQAKAELLGLWAIADCARDSLNAAQAEQKEAQSKQQLLDLEVDMAKERVQGQKRKKSDLAVQAVLDEANDAKIRKGLDALSRLTAAAAVAGEEATGSADVEMNSAAGKEAVAASPSQLRRNPLGVATPATF